MFFQFESANRRDDDLWSSSSPQPEEAVFRLFAAPAAPKSSLSQGSDDDDQGIVLDHYDSAPPSPRQTTELEWQTAAQDSLDGVHYTREKFPSDALTYLAATFSREPLEVEEDEKVVLLDEVSEFALRVRVVRTGVVGVLPAWNVEGALERLARLNMMFNEVATCPKEIAPNDRDATLSSLASHMHVHDYCISEPRLRIAFSEGASSSSGSERSCSSDTDDNDNDMDADLLATPTTPPDVHIAPPHVQKRGKSVEFAMSPKRTIFRYPPPPIDEDEDEAGSLWSDGESEDGYASEEEGEGEVVEERRSEEDEQWWWDGWEESHDVPADAGDGVPEADSSLRVGRSRVRRRRQAYVL